MKDLSAEPAAKVPWGFPRGRHPFGRNAMVEMTLEMEAALADICRLDRGQSFVDVALAIIRMDGVRDQRECLLQGLIWVLENQREAVR